MATEKGLDFNLEIEDGLPGSIVSDSQRLQQIINNLLSNAIKFTSSGRVTISFHTVRNNDSLNFKDKAQGYMGISITDTGIGISLGKQDIIFEAFKQSDGTTSRKYGGTGLGLSISKELAALLGGSIALESTVGKGSTFTLTIPYVGDNQKQSVDEEDILVSSEMLQYKTIDDRYIISANDKSLLIIEDDEVFAKILFELAHEKGYKSLIAKTGLEGINLAIRHKPDAILLDIGLPDINGWKVVEKLKESKNTENISVHVISAGDYYNSTEKMNSVLGYIKKPVSLESLDEVFMKIQDNDLKPLKKLLIVDESMDQFGSIAETLRHKGYQVTLLGSGEEAYNLLTAEVFDCLILDLMLKDMSGVELLTKLRNENITNLQIIIHTENQVTQEDELELQRYTQSIIIKGTRSTERLVSEVSLFLHDLDTKIDKKKIKIIKSEHEKKDALSNKKILMVDDDMRNIFALTGVLEEKGLKVVVARNGKEGVEKLNENLDIDLILMDIMMPEMDGYEAIRKIRKQERHKKTPIIAITAKAMKDDKQKCIDAGANEYLTKPIDMNKFISLLRVWLYK